MDNIIEIKESDVTLESWNNLEKTAQSIVDNSKRDLILWMEVLKHVRECKAKLKAGQVADGDIELPPGLDSS